MTRPGSPIGEDDLQAEVDGVLPAGRRACVDAYLEEHPEARERLARLRADRDEMRRRLADKLAEPIPSRLRIAHLMANRKRRRVAVLGRALAATLLFAVGGVVGWGLNDLARVPSPPTAQAVALLTRDAITAHRTFVVEVRHPVEVDAAQEAHLVQWLSKRLGQPLKVPDLAAQGYKLMGGRLLPASAGPAAQLMYERAGNQRLTIYLRPATSNAPDGEPAAAFRFFSEEGVSAFYWVEQGFSYAIAAETDRQSLLTVAETIYRQVAPSAN